MKKSLFALAAGATLLAAYPAAAQNSADPYRYPGTNANASAYGNTYAGENGLHNRIAQLDTRLQAGIRSRGITTSEARPIRQQIRYLTQLERRYSVDGLSQQERQDLRQRWLYTRDALRRADPNNSRYAQWDRDDQDWDDGDEQDPYGSDYRNTNNGNGYGNVYGAGYGSDGRYNASNRYQQVNEVCRTSTGLSGILAAVFGADNCLRVGERVTTTASLSALPGTLRNDFPDSNSYIYRYIDGRVVEIDPRTSIVSRIYVAA